MCFCPFFLPFFPINTWQLEHSGPDNSRYRVTHQTWVRTCTCVTVSHTLVLLVTCVWKQQENRHPVALAENDPDSVHTCFLLEFFLWVLVVLVSLYLFIYLLLIYLFREVGRSSVDELCELCCHSTSCILKQKWWKLPVTGTLWKCVDVSAGPDLI